MQTRHVPRIDLRYWLGITFASIFGTNLGDFYAHESGFGLGVGLLVLIVLFAATLAIEAKDASVREIHYWLAIILIRTGATNIADYLAFGVRIPAIPLALGLACVIAGLAWYRSMRDGAADLRARGAALGGTDASYWAAMLAAGVFGTVVGDICAHRFGLGPASIGLAAALGIVLFAAKAPVATTVAGYWCAVALARTAGTCMGDWLAEHKTVHVGLPLSTLLTGAAFVAILMLWRSNRQDLLPAP